MRDPGNEVVLLHVFISIVEQNYGQMHQSLSLFPPGGEGAVRPYMCYTGMCGPKGYGFSAVLVIKRVSLLADFGHLVISRVWFCTLALIWDFL